MPRFPAARTLLAAFSLYCIPVIHAAAIVAANAPNNERSDPALVVRSWFGVLLGSDIANAAGGKPVSATASDATAYLRIASLSIALYDFLMTIPGEFRLYASQPGITKMTRACVLFICVRYTSVLALVTSNVGFFGTGFSSSMCSHYQLVAPIFKVFAVLFSQIIVSVRTYAISRKEPWVLYLLSGLFIVCCVPEFLGNVWERVPVQNSEHNCTSGNTGLKVAWLHYLAAMIFDAVAMGISTVYLVMQTANLSLMSGLSRLMLKEGMIYFILLTGANILNLVLFRQNDIAAQSSAASLGQAVTMIMSQHIILSLHDWRAVSTGNQSSNHEMGPVSFAGGNNSGTTGGAIGRLRNLRGLSHPSPTTTGGNDDYTRSAVKFEPNSTHPNRRNSKHQIGSRSVVKDFVRSKRGSSEEGDHDQGPLEIRVQVQEEVKLDYDAVYADPDAPHGRGDGDRKWGPV